MTYESLLLNAGGGIINDNDRSKQFSHTAALCIGIGGTGVAALSDLKGKIYQQLEPDNPGDPIPRYDGIQLLAIDSDDSAYKKYHGNRRLSEGEFFTIKKDNLSTIFTDPKGISLIKNDPMLSWMEIDKITHLLTPEGAGGIRQIGRYLLIKRASDLYNTIQTKCELALKKRGCNSLDIYVFAGISGGTGSGCFLDTCYLVRKAVEAKGWNAKIMGYFFLPDVVTSKSEVSSQKASVDYNNSNGYAAMKELDYLMHLKESNDYFTQQYASGLSIRTQLPPVDMCHLISAAKADGSVPENGFTYGINVASDYAMAYLAEVDLTGEKNAEESSLTMRGHLANVNRGVLGITRRWGANLSYHILGASNAEIPMIQINTYLATGFFQKFKKMAHKPKATITKSDVTNLMEELRLNAKHVYASVVSNSPVLSLTHYSNIKELAKLCPIPKGKAPEVWASEGNNWLSLCEGEMTRNVESLTRELDGYDAAKINEQSLLGRLFQKMWNLSLDPKYGPYYAAAMLNNSGEDLLSALDGEIATAEGQAQDRRIQIPNIEDNQEYCSSILAQKKNKAAYSNYYHACETHYLTFNAIKQCTMTKDALRRFRVQVEELYNNFFRPLCDMLDNLMETFQENDAYLKLPAAKQANDYTWQILSLTDIQKRLDDSIESLNAKQVVTNFVQELMRHPACWMSKNQEEISRLVRQHMLDLFRSEAARNLQDYLFDKYSKTVPAGDVNKLADEIERDILKTVNDKAIPMFWCDPSYDLTSTDMTFESSSLSVPNTCSAVCAAATNFQKNNSKYTVRKTGIGDRIFALRFISGIPLFAYQGVSLLKEAYDTAGTSAAGAGSHLFAKTGRGKEGTLDINWRSYLPIPMPYSKVKNTELEEMHPEGASYTKLYLDAVKRGIIGILPEDEKKDQKAGNTAAQNQDQGEQETPKADNYAIFQTPALKVDTYTLQNFLDKDNTFLTSKYDKELQKIQDQRKILHDVTKNPKCTAIPLKNDGNPDACNPEDVRIDYFIMYKPLQKIVRNEMAKYDQLVAAENALIAIKTEYDAYKKDLGNFCKLLFNRDFICKDETGDIDYAFESGTVRVLYANQYDKQEEYMLCSRGDTYPLYRAFQAFRTIQTDCPLAYNKLKKILEQMDKSDTLDVSLSYVAAILEQVWSADAMTNFRDETIKGEPEDLQNDLLRFYNGLCMNVTALKKKMGKKWPFDMSIKELTKLIVGEEPAAKEEPKPEPQVQQKPQGQPLPAEIYVWYNNETMTMYPHQSMCYAWSTVINDWVKLNSNMFVAKNGQWVGIQLDPYGNLIYN